jgi:hypothetical protein
LGKRACAWLLALLARELVGRGARWAAGRGSWVGEGLPLFHFLLFSLFFYSDLYARKSYNLNGCILKQRNKQKINASQQDATTIIPLGL